MELASRCSKNASGSRQSLELLPKVSARATREKRVLVVDDEEHLVKYLGAILVSNGWTVDTAGSIQSATTKARCQPLDVILLDLKLPDGSGFAVCDALREDGLPTPVVLFTSHGSDQVAFEAGRRQIFGYLNKPSTKAAILTKLNDALLESATRVRIQRREQLRGTAARLVDPDLSALGFLHLAHRFKGMAGFSEHEWSAALHRSAWSGAPRADAQEESALFDLVVAQVDCRLRSEIPDQTTVTTRLGLEGLQLNRHLLQVAGVTFRSLCRALTVRKGVRQLFFTEERIKQIAVGLGYEHHSQFDRDVREVVGMSPRRFRRLLRS